MLFFICLHNFAVDFIRCYIFTRVNLIAKGQRTRRYITHLVILDFHKEPVCMCWFFFSFNQISNGVIGNQAPRLYISNWKIKWDSLKNMRTFIIICDENCHFGAPKRKTTTWMNEEAENFSHFVTTSFSFISSKGWKYPVQERAGERETIRRIKFNANVISSGLANVEYYVLIKRGSIL